MYYLYLPSFISNPYISIHNRMRLKWGKIFSSLLRVLHEKSKFHLQFCMIAMVYYYNIKYTEFIYFHFYFPCNMYFHFLKYFTCIYESFCTDKREWTTEKWKRISIFDVSVHRIAVILRIERERQRECIGWLGIGVNVSVDTPWRCPL